MVVKESPRRKTLALWKPDSLPSVLEEGGREPDCEVQPVVRTEAALTSLHNRRGP